MKAKFAFDLECAAADAKPHSQSLKQLLEDHDYENSPSGSLLGKLVLVDEYVAEGFTQTVGRFGVILSTNADASAFQLLDLLSGQLLTLSEDRATIYRVLGKPRLDIDWNAGRLTIQGERSGNDG